MASVLVACEFSGIVRDAFRARGHDAFSCDVLESERPGPHIRGDVRDLLDAGWDMMIAFPPCTYLCRSGDRWYARSTERNDAIRFVRELMAAPVERWAIENPRGVLSREIRPPDCRIQPWEYGHPESKETHLWLQGLPPLMVAAHVGGTYKARVHRAAPAPDRWKERSRTLPGIAEAMAAQWG